ncbi:HPP family protein [Prosthecomicrobium pneumaticum]|uniref:CBS-domain-containing membrane protein n=1 Tax=Prosthecomicrobium pneumaticum TaxID=81895 RepID=A0A7W9CW26_9HYPH|nr:HPP family protein [Prosthecomicrobium pneumaticum]MBB5752673.1 CBS-domain-containing membrane protein [Prosthecomicrobium pneumaticum]
MRRHIRPFLARHEPRGRLILHLKSGSGAMLGMGLVGALSSLVHLPLLIAPFGATAVLLFGQPASPLAQPINVFGGYLLAAAIGVVAVLAFPGSLVATAIAVGLVIALMLALRVTHPPAGAIPIVAAAAPAAPAALFAVVLIGSASLIAFAVLHHRLPPRHDYPRRLS